MADDMNQDLLLSSDDEEGEITRESTPPIPSFSSLHSRNRPKQPSSQPQLPKRPPPALSPIQSPDDALLGGIPGPEAYFYRRREPEPNPFRRSEPEPNPFRKREPESFRRGEPEPYPYRKREPEPYSYRRREPEPYSYRRREPEPSRKIEPEPSRKVQPEPHLEPELHPEPEPQPSRRGEPHPELEPELHPEPEPQPSRRGEPHPEPEPEPLPSRSEQYPSRSGEHEPLPSGSGEPPRGPQQQPRDWPPPSRATPMEFYPPPPFPKKLRTENTERRKMEFMSTKLGVFSKFRRGGTLTDGQWFVSYDNEANEEMAAALRRDVVRLGIGRMAVTDMFTKEFLCRVFPAMKVTAAIMPKQICGVCKNENCHRIRAVELARGVLNHMPLGVPEH